MANIKIYKDENKYLTYLDLGIQAFKVYGELDTEEIKKVSFSDALIMAYIQYKQNNGSTKSFNALDYDARRFMFKDFGYEMKKIAKVLYASVTNEFLSAVVREIKHSADFSLTKDLPNYEVIVKNIIATDTSLSEEEQEIIFSADAGTLIVNIFNKFAHGKYFNMLNDDKVEREDYIKAVLKINSKIKQMDNAIVHDENIDKVLFSGKSYEIVYHAYRINKDCHFKVNERDLYLLLPLVGKSVPYWQDIIWFSSDEVNKKLSYEQALEQGEFYCLKNKDNISTFFEEYKNLMQHFTPEKRQEMLSLMELVHIDEVQKESILEIYRDMTGTFEANGVQILDDEKDEFFNSAVGFCIFNNTRLVRFIQQEFLLANVIDTLYESLPFRTDVKSPTMRETIAKTLKKESDNDEWLDHCGCYYFLEQDNLYSKMLSMQVLNILQLAESKGLWAEIGEKSNSAKAIAEEYGFEDATDKSKEMFVIEKLRNSFQHVRYIRNKDTLQIYDGRDRDDLRFQFTIYIDELEEIKDTALSVLISHNKNKIDEVENSTHSGDTAETTDEREDD